MASPRVPLAVLAALALAAPGAAQTKLLRFPDVHGERLVFTYAGDLWLASAQGGTATRLTAHPGRELFARFSPDGEQIAFTGQYDGDEQVYVIPTSGGTPRQLTFYPAPGPLPERWGFDNQVYGWTPDGKAVLFRSMRDGWDLSDTRLYTVAVDGGMPEALPMPYSGGGDLSPDGARVVFSPLARDFRHWKRYQGGWAQDLYVFDLAAGGARRVTDHPRTERDPMWVGERIYFSSDRDGTLELFALDLASGETTQLTQNDVWDVRWPSADAGGRIVYERNGELRVLDARDGSDRAASITVPDDAVAARAENRSVADRISDYGLAPKGQRAVFAARGEVFSAPIEHGPTRNLTRSSGAHDREPAWSPDGESIAFVSDRDGEEEIWLVDQAGREEPRQLTDGGTGQKSGLSWSPDSKRIAYRDQAGRLFVLEVESRAVTQVADDIEAFGLSYDWSPRSGWLAYTLGDPNGMRSLYLWNAAANESHRVTDDMWNEGSPVFDPKGDYLFYLSDREFHPQIGAIEFNYAMNRETMIYALALREDVEHPFPPRSDEVDLEDEEKDGDDDEDEAEGDEDADAGPQEDQDGEGAEKDGDEEDGKEDEGPIAIDLDGLAGRVARVPLPADNYFGLAAVEGHLLYGVGGAFYYGRAGDRRPELRVYELEEREETTLAEGVNGWALSPDGGVVLVSRNGGYELRDAKKSGKGDPKKVATDGLRMERVPAEEWAQIFDEVWRRFRDFFYVENMHGYDWAALRDRYRPLLEHVAHRSDLNYVISEMIGELNVSHAYISGGDWEVPERPRAALLGARFELDREAGRYRVARIFPGQNEEPTYRSPLTEIGVDVSVGDYVLAINGAELRGDDNPFRLLRHAGGQPVELLVNGSPEREGARLVTVDPIGGEDDLLYLAWIRECRRRVDELGGGRIGYVHLPDMGGDGLREFIKWFYGQIRKDALIVDVRSNGGGNVSQMVLERLRRKLLMVDFERNVDHPETYPDKVFVGPMACLLDEDTASDGDQFAYVFRQAGLGPLIGKRSWGGVVGIYGRGSLIDGASVSVPEAGSADPEGRWVIEGHGVDPDIEVENEIAEVLKGRDQQLERAVEVLLERLEADPPSLPERPAPPVKTD